MDAVCRDVAWLSDYLFYYSAELSDYIVGIAQEKDVVGGEMDTKIYGTIGPACQDMDTLVRLFEEGMTGIRLNLSHTGLEEAAGWIENIQAAHRKFGGGQLEILMDLQGPELRIGKLGRERMLEEGERLSFVADGKNNLFDPTEIPVPEIILPCLKSGQKILLDDGKIQLETEEIFRVGNGIAAEVVVVRGGKLSGRKSIALSEVELYPPTLTESDLLNIKAAKKFGITGAMLPFVRKPDDLKNLKQEFINENAQDIKIFAKIENMDGVNQLQELMPYCDEIVIARGDLGNAVPLFELPVVQERIAVACRVAQKPFMVVTQMLASMEYSAVPTRAEVSDIYHAVSQGAASVMLTGETASGKYPVEAMHYMVRTVRAAENYNSNRPLAPHGRTRPLEETGSPISSAVTLP